ncbi:MAG: DoxX protein [Oscillatoriales cyanobacterium RM2_1_1]|nr:DoxX protein [Oscillatoriales cyanobacterium SM2_3_0]NJO46997.1 DoxX protein [Oscillatoriales cyanobacterium RM2_1_1]
MTDESKLQISLFIIRVTVAAFFLVWSLEKIIKPELTQRVFSKFYFLEITPGISVTLGILQTLVVLIFLAGIFKLWSYGAILGMHSVSVLSTYQQLLNPYELPNHLFWAGVPALGAIIALFMLRGSDRLLTLKLFRKS